MADDNRMDESVAEPKSQAKDILPVEVSLDDADLMDCSEKENRGVLKKILRNGSGDERPFEGSTVFVHYVGRLLDGTVFDSSRKRNDPFNFELGKRRVIKGWDEGVATMKQGELAELICTPEYAYGKSGSPPNIPPDSTLVFQVELLHWEDEDVSKEKDKSLTRRVLQKGSGYSHPNEDAKCKVKLIGTCNGVKFDEREVEFVVGESEDANLVPGFDLAVRKMKKHERSVFTVHPDLAFGKQGNAAYNIGPNQSVQYEITLNDFDKAPEVWAMSVEQKLEAAESAKAKGTAHFTAGQLKQAVRQYEKMKNYVAEDPEFKDDNEQKRKTLLITSNLNLSMAHLKSADYAAARNAASEAIEKDPTSIKGYYRRGMANFHTKDYDDAKKDFNKVLELDAENKEAKRQLALIAKEEKALFDKEKATFKGMFERFAAADAKKAQPQEVAAGDQKANGTA